MIFMFFYYTLSDAYVMTTIHCSLTSIQVGLPSSIVEFEGTKYAVRLSSCAGKDGRFTATRDQGM